MTRLAYDLTILLFDPDNRSGVPRVVRSYAAYLYRECTPEEITFVVFNGYSLIPITHKQAHRLIFTSISNLYSRIAILKGHFTFWTTRLRSLEILIVPSAMPFPWNLYMRAVGRLFRRQTTRIVFIHHDLIPILHPQFFRPFEVTQFKSSLLMMLEYSSLIINVSDTSKRHLETYLQSQCLPPRMMTVNRSGDEAFDHCATPRADQLRDIHPQLRPGSYFLTVGSIEIRKNHRLLYNLWVRLVKKRNDVIPLVIVGREGWLVDDLLHLLRHDPSIQDHILVLNRIPDEQLHALYSYCYAFLYPSFVEGWGLPVREALSYGKHVIASDDPSLIEAAEGLAQHLDPNDHEAWLRAVEHCMEQVEYVQEREEKVRQAFQRLTWEQSSKRLVDIVTALNS